MPTRIRLQRRGVRNHPYWWIVISSNQTNPGGKIIEKMGFWIPTPGTNERSIILNRPRLKYWLSVGAEPTQPVLKLMSMADFFPKTPPTHGTATLYPKPVDVDSTEMPVRAKELGAYKEHFKTVMAQEKKNEELRKIMQSIEEEHADDPSFTYEKLLSRAKAKMGDEKTNENYKELLDIINKEGEDSQNAQERIKEAMDKALEKFPNDLESVSAETLSAELNIDEEEAESILAAYEIYGNGFTRADLEDFKKDLTPRGLKSL